MQPLPGGEKQVRYGPKRRFVGHNHRIPPMQPYTTKEKQAGSEAYKKIGRLQSPKYSIAAVLSGKSKLERRARKKILRPQLQKSSDAAAY